MTVRASDNRFQPRTADTQVFINVIRDRFPPVFQELPYRKQLDEYVEPGTFVYTVTATDQDLIGSIQYAMIGDYPTRSFFRLDSSTGVITTTNSLRRDATYTTAYRARVTAIDSVRPNEIATATVDITVTRNPNPPIYIPDVLNFYREIPETFQTGRVVINVTATDRDVNDILTYYEISQRETNSQIARNMFFVDQSTGAIRLASSLISTTVDSYSFDIRVCDNGLPRRCANTTGRIVILRTQFPPEFINEPYCEYITDRTPVSSLILSITAVDQDLAERIVYEPVTSTYPFDLDRETGAVTLVYDNLVYGPSMYSFTVRAYDSAYPSEVDFSEVIIYVTQNPSGPKFLQASYREFILEKHELGVLVVNTTAIDKDGDVLRYSMLGDAMAMDFFYVQPNTGNIYLRRRMTSTTVSRFTMTLRVTDQRAYERTDDTFVYVDIVRDNQTPFFINQPYVVEITEDPSYLIGCIYTGVLGRDRDLVGQLRYDAIGVYPAQSFFTVNELNGDVILTRDITEEPLQLASYTLRVIVYDTHYPQSRGTADVTINVVRDVFGPQFQPSATYQTTISESTRTGTNILSVNALDLDGDSVSYTLINSTNSGSNYFYVDAINGNILVKGDLERSQFISRYFMTIRATSGSRSSFAIAEISIVRDSDQPPVFINTPYRDQLTVNQPTPVNNIIRTVVATDSDLVGSIRYNLLGYFPATDFFSLDPVSGQITMTRSVFDDQINRFLYVLTIEAYDTAFPDQRTQADVVIEVNRNPSNPVFTQNTYFTTISNDQVTDIRLPVDVRATDADGHTVSYEITNAQDRQYFYIVTNGDIYIRRSLPSNRYSFTVRARDNAYPERFGSTTVNVEVFQDGGVPEFGINEYFITIPETTAVNNTILTVSATDQDLRTALVYRTVGDYSAVAFFGIRQNGEIYVTNSLLEDYGFNKYYLQLEAQDPFYSGVGTALVEITITRNPSAPVFDRQSYEVTRNENFPVGGVVVSVTATDLDRDTLTYVLRSQGTDISEYFLLNNENGNICLIKSFIENPNVNRYSMEVEVNDNRGSYTKTTRTTVIVNVVRNQSPFFINEPYNFQITESQAVSTELYAVTGQDRDLLGSLTYKVLGDGRAPLFFRVDENTGVITATSNLRLDLTTSYILRVGICDSAVSHDITTATVAITVTRNSFGPVFNSEPYNVNLDESTRQGTNIFTVTATDRDGDTVRYFIDDSNSGSDINTHFYIQPYTGVIFTTAPLTDFTQSQITIPVRAGDQRNPERFDTSNVVITFTRNQFDVTFINEPYRTTVQETQATGSSVYRVTAVDQDILGEIRYEAIGIYPGISFFNVDAETGIVTTQRSLSEDYSARESYTLRVIAYDTAVPQAPDTADVTITINRNPNLPVWSQNSYARTVSEAIPLGTVILTISASDSDGHIVSYSSGIDTTPGVADAFDFFYLNPATGDIWVLRSLTEATSNQYSFNVEATDSGFPSKSSTASVTIFITRAEAPEFIRTPYSTNIQDNVGNGISVYTVTAVDADLQGQIVYEIIGDDNAPSYFALEGSGRIVTRNAYIRLDTALSYTLRVRAYDSMVPSQRATAEVQIGILRNRNRPSFTENEYVRTINENVDIGSLVVIATAIDQDNDYLTYSLSGDANSRCSEFFFIDQITGTVRLARSLLNTGESLFTCTITVDDNGLPSNNVATVTLTVNVIRDNNFPVFTENAEYFVTIDESTPKANRIINVTATRVGLVGRILYNEIGDYPAPTFFGVDGLTGQIVVRKDLRMDYMQFGTYTLRILACDTGATSLTATAEVFITVTRNNQGPVFSPQLYRLTISERTPPGTLIQRLTINDPDGGRILLTRESEIGDTLPVVNTNMFGVKENNCVVFVRGNLTDETFTEYTLRVSATHQGATTPPSVATIIITVLRDIARPEFLNLPNTISVNERADVDSNIFTVSAQDSDLEGSLVFDLIGDFPVRSYVTLNHETGALTLRNSLLSYSDQDTEYTARVRVFDSANPDSVATSTLRIQVNRNPAGPVFTQNQNQYRTTVVDTFPVGSTAVALTATDQDGDAVYYSLQGSPADNEYFYVVPQTGAVQLRRPLTSQSANRFSFTVRAVDDRPSNVQKSAEASVTIDILRDLGPPTFVNAPYVTEVQITQAVNSTFFTVQATDRDQAGSIRYRLEGFEPGTNYFGLNEISGEIFVASSLLTISRTDRVTYTLLISAYDSGAPLAITTETVLITVQRNLFTPAFEETRYETTIFDFTSIGTDVITVSATDRDQTSPENLVLYSIQQSSLTNSPFRIQPVTGLIRTNQVLSQQIPRYTIVVVAEDLSFPFRSSTVDVIINVIQNSAGPVFTNTGLYDVSIPETSAPLSEIVRVQAQDGDEGRNGEIFYGIVDTDPDTNIFAVNSETGSIYARGSLIYASESVYRLTVSATDRGVVPRSSTATVTIRITKEVIRYFSQDEYEVLQPLLLPVGSLVLDVRGTRNDLVYELVGEQDSLNYFNIDSSSGRITLKQSFTNNSANGYLLRLRAYRSQFQSQVDTAIARVYVVRNAEGPIFQHGSLSYTISETQPLGVSIGQAIAIDQDTGVYGRVTYSMVNSSADPSQTVNYFYVHPTTGVITVNANLRNDLDVPFRYRFDISARDQGVPSKSSAVQVTVNIQRNPNGPVFRQDEYERTIGENVAEGTSLLRVRADDADNDALTYSIRQGGIGSIFFEIDSNSGVVSVARRLDTISAGLFEMTVEVADVPAEFLSPRIDTTVVRITVTRNPSAPVFAINTYTARISEYLQVDGILTTVRATDSDSPSTASGRIRYHIQSVNYTPANGFGLFSMDELTGALHLSQPLTKENIPNQFTLIVSAEDQAVVSRSATATVQVEVLRNEFDPVFADDDFEATVDDFYTVGDELAVLTATDADREDQLSVDTPNADVYYFIDPTYVQESELFGVKGDGTVYCREYLQDRASYQFYVVASDKGWQPRRSRAFIRVNVDREVIVGNLGFNIPSVFVSLREDDVTNLSNEITINVNNKNPGSILSCEILFLNNVPNPSTSNSVGPFNIGRTTDGENCLLSFNSLLDREVTANYNVTIGVGENIIIGRKKRQSNVEPNIVKPSYAVVYVYVSVTDANDNAPQFVYPVYPAESSITRRNFYIGATSVLAPSLNGIVTLVATDADEGGNGRISYSLQNTDTSLSTLPFAVDEDGIITAVKDFSFQERTQYRFTARASDSPSDGPVINTQTDVIINLIENKNRFVVVMDQNIIDVTVNEELIRVALQNSLGRIVLIEKITYSRMVSDQTDELLSINRGTTDVTFVVVNHINQAYTLYENTNDPLGITTSSLPNIVNALRVYGVAETIRQPYEFENIQSPGASETGVVYRRSKSYLWLEEEMWVGFLVLAGLIILMSIVCVAILFVQYRRFSAYMTNYRGALRNKREVRRPDFDQPPRFLREQSFDDMRGRAVLSPYDNQGYVGEVNPRYTRQEPTIVEFVDPAVYDPERDIVQVGEEAVRY